MIDSKAYFDRVAEKWECMRKSFFPNEVRDTALEVADVMPGTLAADIGAGTGFVTEGLLLRGVRVIAVDQSQAMLDELKRSLNIFDGLICRHGWAEELPIPDSTVDYVFANMSLHHVEHPDVAIQEMTRILKFGGKLVITDLDEHNAAFLKREHHDRWMGFDHSDVATWFSDAGLTDVLVRDVGHNCCAESEECSETADISIFVASGVKK